MTDIKKKKTTKTTKKKTTKKPELTRQEKLEIAVDKAKTRAELDAALTDPKIGITTDESMPEFKRVQAYLLIIALIGMHVQFKFLRNTEDYKKTKYYLKHICNTAIKTFNSSKQILKRTYKKSLKKSTLPDIEALKMMEEMDKALQFYKDEKKIVKSMLFEFKCYRVSSLTVYRGLKKGLSRPPEDLVDYSNSGLKEEANG